VFRLNAPDKKGPMQLGVCYYPEHWPESLWADDARRMRELGISVVRIGEFSWSRIEPQRDHFNFDWLQRAIDTLHAENLQVVLGTPTATPPKWLIDEHPSILAIDENGQARGFGSRRHYCFSSTIYRNECQRIVERVATAFGRHDAVVAWQTDNEYGCHSTIVSYSPEALKAFQQWCKQRYGSIDQLNRDWGNVFWSMEYTSFAEISLPCAAVTELNPAHRLAFWRFSSDQVASFNRLQVELLRQHSPGRDILHNYMGNFTEFDHYTTAADLDIATWDNYPLGFLDRDSNNATDKQQWLRTGHPDSSAFHHDLYRGVGRGRWWVIEQQPGPVNWAPHNPAPLPGMIRLWALEAQAYGAEVMSWFRWRQAPWGQEQYHSGLLLPDGSEDEAVAEIVQLNAELELIAQHHTELTRAPVAMIFDYAGDQMLRIQPQGENFGALDWVQSLYTACRLAGVDVDILPAGSDLSDYSLVIVGNSISTSDALLASLQTITGQLLIGPRCGSKTEEMSIPAELPPGKLQSLIPIRVTRAESLPDFLMETTVCQTLHAHRWREKIDSDLPAQMTFNDGWGCYYRHNNVHYLNACLTDASLQQFITDRLTDANITMQPLTGGLRTRRNGALLYVFNFGPDAAAFSTNGERLIGAETLIAGDVSVWKVE
jgi:beta-galactosidase